MSVAGAAEALVAAAAERGLTLAVAESLTAGLVSARMADVPGASAVLRGAVVAYAVDLKSGLLGVDPVLLAERGPVDPEVALAMAAGVRTRLGADVGLATTGVAGPGPQDGVPAGTVLVAVAHGAGQQVERLALAGDRARIRGAATDAALDLALRTVRAM